MPTTLHSKMPKVKKSNRSRYSSKVPTTSNSKMPKMKMKLLSTLLSCLLQSTGVQTSRNGASRQTKCRDCRIQPSAVLNQGSRCYSPSTIGPKQPVKLQPLIREFQIRWQWPIRQPNASTFHLVQKWSQRLSRLLQSLECSDPVASCTMILK